MKVFTPQQKPNTNNSMLIEKFDYIQGFEVIHVVSYDAETRMYFGYIDSLGEEHWEYFKEEAYWNKRTSLNHNLCY